MTAETRRQVGNAAWRLAALATLILAAGWDTLGLLAGGDDAYTSPSYDVLRTLTPWGMRAYGPVLGVLTAVTVYAYGRHAAGTHCGYRLLRLCMSLLAGWYVLWSVGVVGAWVIHGQVLSWGAAGKILLTAVICLILARTTPIAQGR